MDNNRFAFGFVVVGIDRQHRWRIDPSVAGRSGDSIPVQPAERPSRGTLSTSCKGGQREGFRLKMLGGPLAGLWIRGLLGLSSLIGSG